METTRQQKIAKQIQKDVAEIFQNGKYIRGTWARDCSATKKLNNRMVFFDENGEELLNYWFSGFIPAGNPKYTITVLQDGVLEPETSSATIFAQIAAGLQVIEQSAPD